MEDNCRNCKLNDEFGFCEKLVVDTRRCMVEDGKQIKAYYIDEREDDDDRTAFITPHNFKCVFHMRK